MEHQSKKSRITVFMLSALAAGHAAAQSEGVQIYGRLSTAVESFHDSNGSGGQASSVARLSSNRSVLGFRGEENLGGGLKALFQIEGPVALDTGGGTLAGRDTRLGLEGAFGTIFGGNWLTPYNASTLPLDPFYPTSAGYMSIMGNGAAPTADNVSNKVSFDRRQQNSLHYWSPKWNGLSLRVARGMPEERPANGARPSLTSLAAIHELGPFYFTAAHERHHEYQGPGHDDSGSKLGLAYQFGQTRLAAVAERLEYESATGNLRRNAYYLSATHQFGAHGVRFGIARAGDGKGAGGQQIGSIKSGADTGATHYTLGYDYNFSRRTSLFVYHTRLNNEANAVYDLGINSLGTSSGARVHGTALGIRHNF